MTVKEISDLCGVSQQSIRNWCAKNNVAKERNARTKASYVIDDITKQAIIEHYSNMGANRETQEGKERTKEGNARTKAACATDDITNQAIIGHYSNMSANRETQDGKERTKDVFSLIEKLQTQLTEKDAQYIELLKAEQDRNKELTETIQKQADTIQQLSAQLTAAQQIQAGTVKALLTEQNKQEHETSQQETVIVPKSETKQGFFSRLFKKKNK